MAPRHESAFAHVREERQRARVDISLFRSLVDHEHYCSNFHQRKAIAGRDINFSSLEGSRLEALFFDMGWLRLIIVKPMKKSIFLKNGKTVICRYSTSGKSENFLNLG